MTNREVIELVLDIEKDYAETMIELLEGQPQDMTTQVQDRRYQILERLQDSQLYEGVCKMQEAVNSMLANYIKESRETGKE